MGSVSMQVFLFGFGTGSDNISSLLKGFGTSLGMCSLIEFVFGYPEMGGYPTR